METFELDGQRQIVLNSQSWEASLEVISAMNEVLQKEMDSVLNVTEMLGIPKRSNHSSG